MQVFIKTNSKKVINYIENQCEKVKNNYFESKKDFIEHLFQSIGIIVPGTEVTFGSKKNPNGQIDYDFETGNLNINKRYYTGYLIDDSNFIY